jgi:hypothetical protein
VIVVFIKVMLISSGCSQLGRFGRMFLSLRNGGIPRSFPRGISVESPRRWDAKDVLDVIPYLYPLLSPFPPHSTPSS